MNFRVRPHKYREQVGWGMSKMGEGVQKVHISSYKISHGDVAYSMVTIQAYLR